MYPQTSNISHTLVGNKIVDHSDVVGALPVGTAPTTSSFLTYYLASVDWAKTAARQDEKHVSFEIWCILYLSFDGNYLSMSLSTLITFKLFVSCLPQYWGAKLVNVQGTVCWFIFRHLRSTLWGKNKMEDILHTTFLNAFHRIKIRIIFIIFLWSLLPQGTQVTAHCACWAIYHYLNQFCQNVSCHVVSPGPNESFEAHKHLIFYWEWWILYLSFDGNYLSMSLSTLITLKLFVSCLPQY